MEQSNIEQSNIDTDDYRPSDEEIAKYEEYKKKEDDFIIPVDIVLKGIVAAVSLDKKYVRILYKSAFGDVYLGNKGCIYKENDSVEFVFCGNYHVDKMPILEIFDSWPLRQIKK